MKNIIFIAPPGAGKGTQSEFLEKKYNYVHISTGDLFRNEIKNGTELGKKIENIMNSGLLVSDEIVTDVLRNRLLKDDVKNGFILDGYPRSYEQCSLLDNLLKELNLNIDIVIYMDLSMEDALHRVLGRLTCPKCKRGYNKFDSNLSPKQENICDDCNVKLVSRNDDNEESFTVRFEQYMNSIEPIIDYYKKMGILKVVPSVGTPEEMFKKIESEIL